MPSLFLGPDVWMVADSLELDRAFLLGQNFGTASLERPFLCSRIVPSD